MAEPEFDVLKIQNRAHTLHNHIQLSSDDDNDEKEDYPKPLALTAKCALFLLHSLFLLLKGKFRTLKQMTKYFTGRRKTKNFTEGNSCN